MEQKNAEQHLTGLMTLLAVARLGKFTAAAASLGVNHSTVSRRIEALERLLDGRVLDRSAVGWEVTALGQRALAAAEQIETALSSFHDDRSESAGLRGTLRLGSPDAFAVHIAAPALGRLQSEHPDLEVELISATQRARQNRTGLDLEIVVGRPELHRASAAHVMDYSLRLYATAGYLQRFGEPNTIDKLADHRLNYYVESVLTVDDLDRATAGLPRMRRGVASTNVLAHVTTTLAGTGIGLLPDYLAEGDNRLRPVLEDSFSHAVSYWAVGREEALRNPAVHALYSALRA